MTSMTGSAVRDMTRVTIAPTMTPMARPPTATTTNSTPAEPTENAAVPAATTAVRYTISADASLTRLSPSRIVTIRRGTPSRRKMAVAATASGGATIAPSATAAAIGIPVICSATTTRR